MTFEQFCRYYDLHLDAQQKAAVQETVGPILLLAVPGSGKTTTLIARLGWLLECGLDPRASLTMTYTVAATQDMRRRFASVFGEEYASLLEFRTINGVCAKIIRQYERLYQREAFELIAEESDVNKLLREAYRRCELGYPSENDLEDCKTKIAFCKNGMLTDTEIQKMDGEEGKMFPVYDAYRTLLREKRLMDYDDQMVYALKILERCPEILQAWQKRYYQISVDEAQDTSRIQHEIIRLLAEYNRNLFMVGDEDQSIYGFRAAYPQALADFRKTWTDGKVLFLETNYRSTKAIVEKADLFIRQNPNRHEKHMITHNQQGEAVQLTTLRRREDQYDYLLQRAANAVGELAILYRNNDSALPLIDLLEKRKIPYCCRGAKTGFFQHAILRDVLDFLRFASRPDDSEPFLRLYYKLRCGITKEMAQKTLKASARQYGRPLLDILADLVSEDWRRDKLLPVAEQFRKLVNDGSVAALDRISNVLGYREYLTANKTDPGKLNILMALARQNPGQEELIYRLRELEYLTSKGKNDENSIVTLSTIHASKGLEYESVILMDAVDGVFPQSAEAKDREESLKLAEERRIFYVGVTRAQERLELLRCLNHSTSFVDAFYYEQGVKIPGETHAVPKPAHVRKKHQIDESRIQMGITVIHRFFGTGVVESREENLAFVRFEDGTLRKIMVSVAARSGVLRLPPEE